MATFEKIFKEIVSFEWDDGNDLKSWKKHLVTNLEAEQVFFQQPLLITESKDDFEEKRFLALGVIL